ncbi:MAG: DUF4129 domain-containing protein [Lachnospiraceae bacterium]|nr:DUF4129 domain-containing protein [Lachnospiraceae bacterium]
MVMITILKYLTDCIVWYIFASFAHAYFGIPLPTAVLVLVPAAAYGLWILHGRYFGADYDRQLEKFRKLNLIWLVLPSLALLRAGDGSGTFVSLIRMIVPPLILYYLLQMLLFRILRQDPAVYGERRFQRINLLMMAGIGFIGLLLTSTRALYGASRVLLMLWTGPVLTVLGGILWLFSYTIGIVIYGTVTLFLKLFSRGDVPFEEEGGMPQATDPALFADSVEQGAPQWLMMLLAVLAAVIILWLLRKLFILLADRSMARRVGIVPGETRSAIRAASSGGLRERITERFSPAGRIRRSFRHLQKKLLAPAALSMAGTAVNAAGLPGSYRRFINGNGASEDVMAAGELAYPDHSAEIRELTELYRRARYEDRQHPVTAKDAARAEELERRIS